MGPFSIGGVGHFSTGGNNDDSSGGNNPTIDFRGERRSNETHASRTDPDARLVKKARGQASHLGYHGHVLMENRNGLVAQATLTIASGYAEREAAPRRAVQSVPAAGTSKCTGPSVVG